MIFGVLRVVTTIISLFGKRKSRKTCSSLSETTVASCFYRKHARKRIFQIASTYLKIARRDLTENSEGEIVPLEAWGGPEGSTKLRFPDFTTTAQDGGRVVNLTHRPPLPPGNAPGTHLC